MPWCSHCKEWCETHREDLSFDYGPAHCTWGKTLTHHELGDLKSVCCDEDVTDYNEDGGDER